MQNICICGKVTLPYIAWPSPLLSYPSSYPTLPIISLFIYLLSPQLLNQLLSHPLPCRNDPSISLNFKDILALNNLILHGYHFWVNNTPPSWKEDDFLQTNSPILITSHYGQNASIALPGNNSDKAHTWNREFNYSKVAFLTFALTTSIEYIISFSSSTSITYQFSISPSRYYHIHNWDIVPI